MSRNLTLGIDPGLHGAVAIIEGILQSQATGNNRVDIG